MRIINRWRIRRTLHESPRPKLGSMARLTHRAYRNLNRNMRRTAAADVTAHMLSRNEIYNDMKLYVSDKGTFSFAKTVDFSKFNPSIVLDSKPSILGVDMARSDSVDAFAYSVMGYMRNRRSVYDWFLPEEGRPK